MIETTRIDLPAAAGQAAVWLQCRVAGPAGAPLLVFMHGFPEAAFIWDDMLERFGKQYRCVAPNLRGYPGSYAPTDVESYRAQHLITDMAGLIQVLGGGPVEAVIAHDWGGAVAWGLAIQCPQLMKRLVMLNSPHPGTFLRALRTSAAQQAASAYMNYLRRPDAAALLAADDFAVLWGFFTRFGGATWLSEALKSEYRHTWTAGLTGPLNYYRASPLHPPETEANGRPDTSKLDKINLPDELLQVRVPTTVIWGDQDTALLPELLDGLDRYVADLQVQRLPQCSHWLVHEAPQAVGDAIAAALAR